MSDVPFRKIVEIYLKVEDDNDERKAHSLAQIHIGECQLETKIEFRAGEGDEVYSVLYRYTAKWSDAKDYKK